ncbi:hypothetical protein [Pseudogracilibacillus sp. SO30301A]|uniref:hypothetical protein n=1 Tax=Pseudogracilibacillus sp. SO30301A TaxID=3098291 RepID=UPI00300E4FAA
MENQNLNEPSKEQDPVNPVDEHVFKEETSAEFTEDTIRDDRDQARDENRDEVNNVYGWIAIALSAISFFFIPILFAGAGIILGFIARNREAQILGNTAIVIGILSIITRLFIMPLI